MLLCLGHGSRARDGAQRIAPPVEARPRQGGRVEGRRGICKLLFIACISQCKHLALLEMFVLKRILQVVLSLFQLTRTLRSLERFRMLKIWLH